MNSGTPSVGVVDSEDTWDPLFDVSVGGFVSVSDGVSVGGGVELPLAPLHKSPSQQVNVQFGGDIPIWTQAAI